ncbi:MAG: hypothetical protein EOP83_12970, partial [Verrucomicrobiaceae bacterium]
MKFTTSVSHAVAGIGVTVPAASVTTGGGGWFPIEIVTVCIVSRRYASARITSISIGSFGSVKSSESVCHVKVVVTLLVPCAGSTGEKLAPSGSSLCEEIATGTFAVAHVPVAVKVTSVPCCTFV